MLQAGKVPDRGGFTRAGRAFEKHAQINPLVWGSLRGDVETKNKTGQSILEEVINSPNTQWFQRYHALRKKEVIEGKLPGGKGERWSADGREFIGFLG
ncbi:MAG: hypothetical protein BRC38_14580 [Cyanobacteria bacterium QH_6_48_35]|nr:MAG: hypothetical protein BRC34_00805 [Cyanobacteria bacterium QH_1_48_107]PSO63004.1 MAG: hypothetical protein BRC38_14580 [Cyanobacteria bacterium QH_6_48_35]